MIRQSIPSTRAAALALAQLVIATCPRAWARTETALDEYVATPDPAYTWELARTVQSDDATLYVLDLTSQTWRKPGEVDRTVWQHWVSIVKPRQLEHASALLLIGGGKNGGEPPSKPDSMTYRIALETRSVTAELRMIPNQPLTFVQTDNEPRTEDDLIAYGWDQFLKTGDALWLARLPMTKSAVRAMDAIQAFLATPEAGGAAIEKFVVAGGSKRGWTTWTTGAVDPRVCAIVPIVIDVVNLEPSMRHHHAAYGFWAPAIGDYVHHRIMDRLGTPELDRLLAIVDPFSYRDRYTMPKYVINATGDQFFLPDSSQFYFGELPGEKHLRYVPNADHSLKDTDAPESLLAFYQSVLNGVPRPRFSWQKREDGALRVVAADRPREVNLWQATNPDARDFRLVTLGRAWTSAPLAADPDGAYTARVPAPDRGWTAFLVELVYDSGGKYPFTFTTEVVVTPDTLPFAGRLDAARAE